LTVRMPGDRAKQWTRPDVAVMSVAKQSPGGCAPGWGLPRRFAPRNDSEPADRPPFLRSPQLPRGSDAVDVDLIDYHQEHWPCR
jgi:hypothetical protein